MAKYSLTENARLDLAFVYRQGLDQFGEQQANLYLDEIFHLFDLLADNPEMGFDFEVQGKKFQRLSYQSHVLIFEKAANGVKILRVFYGGSDYLKEL